MTELEIGGVVLAIDYRRMEEDRGSSVKVFGDIDGQRVQLLRFDCFDQDPHYHYAPTGVNRMFHLDRLTMGCPVAFTLDQVKRNTRSMVAAAGFEEFSEGVDQDALAARIGEVQAAIEAEAVAG
ncbi:MAG: hypothetical protein VX311_04955 [Planctomycetota bacterium]|nr:hypothetical protein [Planctomycetota bacterium]MEE3283911.1 hypothetical protein [Planctomycetota bacterium]